MLEIEFEFLRLVKSIVFKCLPLREKCPETELFLACVQPEYTKIRTRKNSVFGHFSQSARAKKTVGSSEYSICFA